VQATEAVELEDRRGEEAAECACERGHDDV
jgi:hypothetical protein